jgi:hypothetical protein
MSRTITKLLGTVIRRASPAAVFALFVLSPGSAIGQSVVPDSVRTQLIAIARQAVAAEQNAFIRGNPEQAIAASGLAARHGAGVKARIDRALQLRSRTLATRHRYTAYSDSLIVGGLTITGDTASLDAGVRVTYTHSTTDNDALAPRAVGQQNPYRFTFARQNGTWALVNVQQREIDAYRGGGVKTTATPLTTRQGFRARSTRTPPPPTPESQRPDDLRSLGEVGPGPFATSVGLSPSLTDIVYDWQSAIAYARNWAYGRNPIYPEMRNFFDWVGSGTDCTNFISQIMYNGSWRMTSGDKTSTTSWYLNGTSPDWYWSDSWSFADKWRLMGIRLSRVTGVNYWDQLLVADVVEFDWGPNPDAYIDHAMFITIIDSYGEIYLTAHSNDRLDYPLSSVLASSDPATISYGWHVNDSYPYPAP